jgi:hypothetical protein
MSARAKSRSPGAAPKAPHASERSELPMRVPAEGGREHRSAIIRVERSREEQIAGRGAKAPHASERSELPMRGPPSAALSSVHDQILVKRTSRAVTSASVSCTVAG